ncbi:MAG: hypothetical protein ABS911_05065 [Carnobacterium sp.]|uniref:hypothetical protein n=1 Tax=Carnobacterium sp. TaxID=48221 RepID=UPI003316021D
MSSQLTEHQVLQKLGIPDFRHMTKDKVVSFASMIQNMDPKVAKRALEQFPELTKIITEIVKNYREILEKTVDANSESNMSFYNSCDKVINALDKCLENENISFDEKKYFLNEMIRIIEMKEKKDTENKHFNWKIVSAGAFLAIAAIGAGASVLGGNTNIKFPKLKI